MTRIAAAAEPSNAGSTREVHAACWRRWVRWCAERDLAPLPANRAAVCAYLAERAAAGRVVATLDQDFSSIAYHHRIHGLLNPVDHYAVRQVRQGLRHLHGVAPVRLAHPLTPAEIRRIIGAIDHDSEWCARRCDHPDRVRRYTAHPRDRRLVAR